MMRRGLTQLAGHFDEVAFFPLLERIGLAPRRQLTDWRPTLLEASLDEIEVSETLEWRVLLPVIICKRGSSILIHLTPLVFWRYLIGRSWNGTELSASSL